MTRREDPGFKVFTLYIQGVNIDNISLEDIAEYLSDFSQLLGKDAVPKYHSITRGSLKLAAKVPAEHELDVKNRGFLIRTGDAPEDAVRAKERISRRLGIHRAKKATLVDQAENKVLEIPIEKPITGSAAVPALTRAGSLQGSVIRLGGRKDIVPVDIQDVDGHIYACKAKRDIAKRLGREMFEKTVRVHGSGKWTRTPDGIWEVEDFMISDFEVLDDTPLSEVLTQLRSIDSGWKDRDSSFEELERLRHGEPQ